jgi:hypothetical protein
MGIALAVPTDRYELAKVDISRCSDTAKIPRDPKPPQHGQGLAVVHFSAQPEPFLTQKGTLNSPLYPPTPVTHPLNSA